MKRRDWDNFTNYVVMMSLISNSDDKDTYKKGEKQEIWAWSGIYYGILWDFRNFEEYAQKTAAAHHRCCRCTILQCTEKIYFEALRAFARNSRVHIKILERDEEHNILRK